MSARADRWSRWLGQVSRAGADPDALHASLMSVARQMRIEAGRSGGLKGEFHPLGIGVARARLAASGSCHSRDGHPLVLVAAGEPPARQRFTVAHEVAHLLLDTSARREFGRRQEERLCDEFASEYLIGRAPLRRLLEEQGTPRIPEDLLRLCGHFKVNVKPMLLALRPALADLPRLFIASRWRGHPDRPWELDMRIDASAGHRRLFMPTHQRLRSLGLEGLADWAEQAPLHSEADGCDLAEARPRLRAEPVWPGNVDWQARVQGLKPRFVLAVLDVTELISAPRVPLALAA